MRRVLPPLLLLAGVFACQNYTFHHVTATPVWVFHADASITAAPGIPYIVMLQDMSGSMCEPINHDAGIADGGSGAGDCAANQALDSKIGLVATNVPLALSQLPNAADGGNPFFIGLATFPSAENDAGVLVQGCVPTEGATVPVGPSTTAIPQINAFYAGSVNQVGGGTPTAASMKAAGNLFPTPPPGVTAKRYLLLLTDGLPNCNLLHPCVVGGQTWSDGLNHGCMSPAAAQVQHSLPAGATPPAGCQCSYGACPNPTGPGANNQCCFADPSVSAPGLLLYDVAAAQCLDDQDSINVAAQLYAAGIEVYVIGMGVDFADFSLLDQIAQAGQGSIDAGHVQADDEHSLYLAIYDFLKNATTNCTYSLSAPVADPALIEVQLNGNTLPYGQDGGFAYGVDSDGGAFIQLSPVACTVVGNLTITALGGGGSCAPDAGDGGC